MQADKEDSEFNSPARKSRLKVIVFIHLLIVVSFFIAVFIWGNVS